MSEKQEQRSQPEERGTAAAAAMLAMGSASRGQADAYLEKQTKLGDIQAELGREQIVLARLQAEDLRREDTLRHWSLWVHHISDVMKLSFEFAIAILLLSIVVLVGGAVWAAVHDNGLVIEAFQVPPDMAQRGLSGQVVASQLLDRLIAMQNATISVRPAQSYVNNWGDDIKVQIPDTGVSIGEFNRYLHGWLGHQTRITGEVYRTAVGGIVVTARAGSDGGITAAGRETDFDALVQEAALGIYKATQPYRYAIYEAEQGNTSQMVTTLEDISGLGHAARDRAWAYVGLSVHSRIDGNISVSIDDDREAIAILPNITAAYVDLDDDAYTAGHEEESLSAARAAVHLLEGAGDVEQLAEARAANLVTEKARAAFYTGDFGDALLGYDKAARIDLHTKLTIEEGLEGAVLSLAGLHEETAARDRWRGLPPAGHPAAVYERVVTGIELAYTLGDWRAVLSAPNLDAAFARAWRAAGAVEHIPSVFNPRQGRAYTAYALAMTGNLSSARDLIAKTPLDCDECVRIRGNIDALAGNWAGASYWFRLVASRSPDVPFADTDWGRMLLAKGDYGGAIEKFQDASRIGPHFADPLEMWGEALVRQNRSDLAIAKFVEANKYAPNWGRLHLKWGEALLWTGDKAGAARQFQAASHLDFSSSDKIEFAHMSAVNG